jgi:mono/diheme cytochrome c family protein
MSRKAKVVLAILLGGPLALVGLIYVVSEIQLNRVYTIPPANLHIPDDETSLARGKHLIETVGGCVDCHGYALFGRLDFDNPYMGTLVAPNLTPGQGGVGRYYSAADWERSIRHGVGQDGRALIGVSAVTLHNLSDADTAAIIAYLQSLPARNREWPPRRIGPLARPFLVLFPGEMLPATAIDHEARPRAPEPAVTVDYGRYLVSLACVECHKEDLGGGSEPGEGMNITTGGNLGQWTEADFIKTLRTGRTPEGQFLETTYMPQDRLRHLTEDELRAIWLYIQTLPPVYRENTRP